MFFNKIDKVLVGKIEKIEQWKELDKWDYKEYNCYKMTVAVGTKKITLTDNYSKVLFSRYDLKAAKNIS